MRMLVIICVSVAALLVIAPASSLHGKELPLEVTSPSRTNSSSQETSQPDTKNLQALIEEISGFVGDQQVVLPAGRETLSVADRLLIGFQQDPPRKLQLEDNRTIYWGWQEGQAFVQSIAVFNAEGAIEVVGAVDDLPRLFNRQTQKAVVDAQAYQELLRKYASWGSTPSVVLFARDGRQLASHLPLIQRWLQAAMLGFNMDCSDPDAAPACAFAEQVSVPHGAYMLDCEAGATVNRCPLPVTDALPNAQALPVPLEAFRQ